MTIKEKQQKRTDDLLKAVNRQDPSYVPVLANPGAGIVGYSGMTLRAAMEGGPDCFCDAISKLYDDLYCDATICCMPSATLHGVEIMGFAQFQIAPDDTTTIHVQKSYMKGDEYDSLIAGPTEYVKNVLLPRKYPWILTDDMESVKSRIKNALDEQVYAFMGIGGVLTEGFVEEKYGLAYFQDNSMAVYPGTPAIDILFDTLRGFKDTLVDIRRNYSKVKEACDALWEERVRPAYENDIPFAYPFGMQVPHIPAYLSPKAFGELYWPQEKMILEKMAAAGNKMSIILEGKWAHVFDYLKDAPKDSMIMMLDDDDIFDVNDALGEYQIIAGGAKIVDLKTYDRDKCLDITKKVIDTCAPGGGFIFTTDKIWNSPGDITQNLLDVYSFAHEYGKY